MATGSLCALMRSKRRAAYKAEYNRRWRDKNRAWVNESSRKRSKAITILTEQNLEATENDPESLFAPANVVLSRAPTL